LFSGELDKKLVDFSKQNAVKEETEDMTDLEKKLDNQHLEEGLSKFYGESKYHHSFCQKLKNIHV
jgi:hypothetical protein